MAEKPILSDVSVDGKMKVDVVPNSQGSILTHNANTKEVSTRTNAEIIQDLGLVTNVNLNNYINKNFDNTVVNGDWRIESTSGDGYITFVPGDVFRIGWGSSATTFTDEGVIDLYQFGFRQDDNVGENHLYYDNYFKNTSFINPNGFRPFTVTSSTLVPNLNSDLLDGKHASEFMWSSHPSNNITQNDINNWSSYIGYRDLRSINASSIAPTKFGFGFTTWGNNNGSEFADYIHFGGYGDSSGGNQNLMLFKKNGPGIRQFQSTSQSVTNYSTYVDYWHSGNFNPLDFIPSEREITINGVTQDLTADRTWTIPTDFVSTGFLSGRVLADANSPSKAVEIYYLNGSNRPVGSQDGVLQSYSFDNNQWYAQMYADWRTNEWYVRTKNKGTWLDWKKVLHAGDFNPSSKVDAWEGATALGFVNGNPAGTPYVYSSIDGLYRHLATTGFVSDNYLPLSGGTLTGGGIISSNGNISVQQSATGGNATGLFWQTIDDSANIAGIGTLTDSGLYEKSYIGWGASPWDSINNLTVAPDRLAYKDLPVFHAGATIDYPYGVQNIINTGDGNWAQRKLLSTSWSSTYGDHVIMNVPGLSANNVSFKLTQSGNGYINDKKILTELDTNGFVKIGGTGTFNNPIFLGWDNNHVRIQVDSSYIGSIFHTGNLDPVTRNTYQDIIARKDFSGATGNTYSTSALMVNGNGSTIFPSIGFHQTGVVGATISVRNDSKLYFNDNPIWHSGNLDPNNFVTRTGAPETITSQKTFTNNITVPGVVDVNTPSPDRVWTTDGRNISTGNLGRRDIQFRYEADGGTYPVNITPIHDLANVYVEIDGTGDITFELPEYARVGQEVQFTNYSQYTLKVKKQNGSGNSYDYVPLDTARFLFVLKGSIGDVNEDEEGNGFWIQVSVLKTGMPL